MGQVWQFDAKTFERESTGKVSGAIVKMSVDAKSGTLLLATSSLLIVQLVLGSKKMHKKLGLNIKKDKTISWKVSRFASQGFAFISESNLITFVDLKRKKLEKVDVVKWIGSDAKLLDFRIDLVNGSLFLLTQNKKLIILENRNDLRSVGQLDWTWKQEIQLGASDESENAEYDFFNGSENDPKVDRIIKSGEGKVLIYQAKNGEICEFYSHCPKVVSLSLKNLNNIRHESAYELIIDDSKEKKRICSNHPILEIQAFSSKLLIHRRKQILIIQERALSNILKESGGEINLMEIEENFKSTGLRLEGSSKNPGWIVDVDHDYSHLGLFENGFVTLNQEKRLRLFNLKGKLEDEIRVDTQSQHDRLEMEVNKNTVLVKFNRSSFKIFRVEKDALRLVLGGLSLQRIREGLASSYTQHKWKLLTSAFNTNLDKLACLFVSNLRLTVLTVLDLQRGQLSVMELETSSGEIPRTLIFDRVDPAIIGVSFSKSSESMPGKLKVFWVNFEGQIKKMDQVVLNDHIVSLQYPQVGLTNGVQGLGIMEGQIGPITEEVRTKCIAFGKAISQDRVSRALELIGELEQKVEGRVLETMMSLCLQKENVELAEFTLKKMKFLRGKMLLGKKENNRRTSRIGESRSKRSGNRGLVFELRA